MKGVQHVSMTDLVITKHITMEKWKKNKRHLSEKRTTKFDFWKRRETYTHTKKDTTGKSIFLSVLKQVSWLQRWNSGGGFNAIPAVLMRFPWVEHLNPCWCSCICVWFEHTRAPSGTRTVHHTTQLQPKPHAALLSSDNTTHTRGDYTELCCVDMPSGEQNLLWEGCVFILVRSAGATPTLLTRQKDPHSISNTHTHTVDVQCSTDTCSSWEEQIWAVLST